MKRMISSPITLMCCLLTITLSVYAEDTLMIRTVGHGSVMFDFNETIVHVDPWSSVGTYSELPDADIIAVTHGHGDHYDLDAIAAIQQSSTVMVFTQTLKDDGAYTDSSVVLNNWDSTVVQDIPVKAVPAYNLTGDPIRHKKGTGNGYIFTFGELKVYVAGDTENIPEMDTLGQIDIAFLPMNLPYTMTPEQAADAARMVDPDVLYIYHYDESDTANVRSMLSDEDMEIRIGPSVHYHPERETDMPTAINDISNDPGQPLYPNPVKEHLQLIDSNVERDNYRIYNAKGVLLEQSTLQEGQRTIAVNHLEPGLYILEVGADNKKTAHKFVKQ